MTLPYDNFTCSKSNFSGRFTHPDQDRGLTMREVRKASGFSDNYDFEGSTDDVYRQIGEAVPPLLSLSIATHL